MGRGIIKPLRSQESEVYKAHKNLKNAGVYIRTLRVSEAYKAHKITRI
jgi:hypothetical protein